MTASHPREMTELDSLPMSRNGLHPCQSRGNLILKRRTRYGIEDDCGPPFKKRQFYSLLKCSGSVDPGSLGVEEVSNVALLVEGREGDPEPSKFVVVDFGLTRTNATRHARILDRIYIGA